MAGGMPCSPCPAGSSSSGGDACAPCPERQSSRAGGVCAACPAGQSAFSGGPCTACSQLANHDFRTFGLNGWYMMFDTFSYTGGLFAASAGGTCPATPPRNCFGDITGAGKPGSNVLVSINYTVLPGGVLTVTVAADIISFAVSSPDTMHMHIRPPAPIRSQARIDVYDASNPAFPTAASLYNAVFDASNIEAGPYLGNLNRCTQLHPHAVGCGLLAHPA